MTYIHKRSQSARVITGTTGRLHRPDPAIETIMHIHKPDNAVTLGLYRLGRMINGDYPTVDDHVRALMGEFAAMRSCRVSFGPMNEHGKPKYSITVGERAILQNEQVIQAMSLALIERRPIVLDHKARLKLAFQNLDMNDRGFERGRYDGAESVGIMPLYYRKPEEPIGVGVFCGSDLRPRGSQITGLTSTFWTASALALAAAQLSFILTHKLDATTVLTKKIDFEADFADTIAKLRTGKIKSGYLIFIDGDQFKTINDGHGYLTGDEVLLGIATAIRNSVRREDVASRWGGDEFAAILRDVSCEEALQVGERIRRIVSNMRVQTTKGIVVPTVSIGIVNLRKIVEDGRGRTAKTLCKIAFELADQRLHSGKDEGRNRVVGPPITF